MTGGAAISQPPRAVVVRSGQQLPMVLGAGSNFSQGWSEQTFTAATELGVTDFRGSIRWADVERSPGEYTFDHPRTQYPAQLAAIGARLVLTVSGSNPLYDNGQTPHSPQAVAAFAQFVRAVVERYPAVSAIEVGNEFNGSDFVTGSVRTQGLAQRARYHLALLRAVAEQVRDVRPELPILGGATHSIPVGYLWDVLDTAGPSLIDGLAIHPYTTRVDQLPAQIGVLRRNSTARGIPIYVTEFGVQVEAEAPDHMLRGYATMASLGFAALVWYPLNERGDGMVPLIRRDGSVTAAGEAFRFIRDNLAPFPARDISPDAFTFVHAFGDRVLVLWGGARPITLSRPDISAFDARGNPLDERSLTLAPDRAVVLRSEQPLRLGDDVQLACITLIADSFYQFAYPQRANTGAAAGFTATLRTAASERSLVTLPGQQRGGVPWVPYLGLRETDNVRLMAETMALGAPGRAGRSTAASGALVQHWVPPGAGRLRLDATLTPALRNQQMISVEINQAGRRLFADQRAGPVRFVGPLGAGQLEVVVASTGGRASLDYRLRIHDDARCSGAE